MYTIFMHSEVRPVYSSLILLDDNLLNFSFTKQ